MKVDPIDKYLDKETRPQDDFFRYANGKWLDETVIPPDKSRWGSFVELREKSLSDVRHVLEREMADPKFNKALLFYATGTNMGKRNSDDFLPIQPLLERINTATSTKQLIESLPEMSFLGDITLFSFTCYPDIMQSDREAPRLYAGGLNLPGSNRDYYFDEDKEGTRTAYLKYLTDAFELINHEDPASAAQNTLKLETCFAETHRTQVEKRDDHLNYNKFDLQKLPDLNSKINWPDYFSKFTDIPVEYIIVDNPDYFRTLDTLVEEESLQVWKDYMIAKLLIVQSPYLSERFADLHFDFFGKTLSGQQEQEDLWKRIVSLINSRFILGELVGQLYIQEFFPPAAKEKMETLVANLMEAMRHRIKKLDWMSEETKVKALEKLGNFRTKIGYPDRWTDYSELELDEGMNFVQMVQRCKRFAQRIKLSRMYKTSDPDEWLMSPQTVNAYYMPPNNEIVFPAAILQFPFFSIKMSDAENYGGIGTVIGHEITHGFDDRGSKYDAHGNLKNWWTDEDRKKFDAKGKYFIQQYESFLVYDKPLNGKLTLGENIADHGGIKVSLDALRLRENHNSDLSNGYTDEELFFLSYARIWRAVRTKELAERFRMIDPHSPPKARVNVTLANIAEFHQTFNIKPNDGMYREQLPVLW